MKKSILTLIIMTAVGGLAVTACGSPTANSTSNGSGTNNSANGSQTTPTDTIKFQMPPGDGVLKGMPQSVLDNYSHYTGAINKSPYSNFKAVKKPWVIYYNNSFSGNAWRAAALQTIEADVAKYKAAGLVSKLVVTDSNNDTATQIQQMQTAIEQHASLILTIPGSSDAMNGVIKKAYQAGIPVVTIAAPVTSPYALNQDTNEYMTGAKMAEGIVQTLKGKGNVLMVNGIAGTPGNAEFQDGANAVFSKYPNIKIVGEVNGNWSPSAAETATLQFLATHPEKIDAVWQQGSMFSGVMNALKQSGRPIVPVTIGNPDQASLAYAHDHLSSGYQTVGSANPPGADADAAFRIGILTLMGDGPKVNTFVQDPPLITNANLSDWYKSSYTEQSTGVGEPPAGTWISQSDLASLFNKTPKLPVPTMYSGQ